MNRRTFLRGTAGASGIVALSGCLDNLSGGDEDSSSPVDLSGGKLDYQGGMEIGRHAGPNGQIFYADQTADTVHESAGADGGQENLAWFHTLVHGLFPYHFERLGRGWEADGIYVTDYSRTDWELVEMDNQPHMPSPTAPETFADATELTYVAESNVAGGMGPELFPFSEESEASMFAQEYNGTLLEFDNIDQSLIESLRNGSHEMEDDHGGHGDT